MEATEIQPWFFQVQPLEGESISHFLGCFRRENELSPTGLGRAAGLGAAIARWEQFRFNPRPTLQQLEKLSAVVGVQPERLGAMLPPERVSMKHEPIRLCAACYTESPCHQIKWQFKESRGCDRHQLSLLSECPNCGARLQIPALWIDGLCHRCFTSFAGMVQFQKPVIP